MKIAIVVEHLDGGEGGTLAWWVAGEMGRRGHEVHVLCHDVAARVGRYRQATQRASFDAHRSRRAHGGGHAGEVHEEMRDEGGANREIRVPSEANREIRGPSGANQEIHGPGEVRVHRLGGMRLKTALGMRVFGARARAWCRRGVGGRKFDVVHSFTVACPGDIYHAQAGVYAAMQAQAAAMRKGEAGRQWKRILQRLPGKQRTLLALEGRAVRRARRVISPCGMMTEQFREYCGAEAASEGGRVVTLAVPRLTEGDKETGRQGDGAKESAAELRGWFRGHYGIGAGDRVAVFVGHDFRRKGLRQAIEAVGRTRDWKLVVVGLGKVREYVALAQELGLAAGGEGDKVTRWHGDKVTGGRVMFIGPTKEMEAVYAAGDALLLPAFYEASGVVALEALGHGLPVVSTVYLGLAGEVREQRVGMIVEDPRDVGGLARALEGLAGAGSAEREALAKRARGVAAGYGAAGYGEKLEGLYREAGGR